MERDVETRFQRIEATLDRFAQGMDDLRVAHQEVESAQLNIAKAHEKLIGVVTDLGERMSNLTILVDQLVKRDMGGNP